MQRVAIYLHGEAVGLAAGRDGLCDQAARDVVRTGNGGAIGGGDVEAHPAGRRRCVQRYGEGETAGAAVAFDGADIVDAQPRQVIVAQGAGGAGRHTDLIPAAGGEGQHYGLVRFDHRVPDRSDAHRGAGDTRADHQRRADRVVVATTDRGAAQGERDRQRYRVGPIQGDGVDQRHAAILVDACRRDTDRGHRCVIGKDGTGGAGGCAHCVTGACRHGEDHRFIGFDIDVGNRNDAERGAGGIGRDYHAGHRAGVVGAADRSP